MPPRYEILKLLEAAEEMLVALNYYATEYQIHPNPRS